MKCRGCGKKLTTKEINENYRGINGVFRCSRCGAIQGTCYKGESYEIVKPWMADGEEVVHQDFQKYYDLTILDSHGLERRHGWFDIRTGLIIQVG